MRFRSSNWAVAIVLLMAAAAAQAAQPRIIGKGNIKNFQTQSEEQQRKTVIRGTNAVEVKKDLYEITELRVDTFKNNNIPELILSSPLCYLNNISKEAFSARDLLARTPDGKFSIKGTGFNWESKGQHLVLSNEVTATIQRAALKLGATNSPVATARTTNAEVKITSEHFDYTPIGARFERSVTVQDPQGRMTSGALNLDLSQGGQVSHILADGGVQIDYQETHASGERATFDVENDLFTLTNQTRWAVGERTGSSSFLKLNRTRNELQAIDNVRLRLPYRGTNNVANATGKTNPPVFLDITSQQLDYATNIAYLAGGVTIDGPPGNLRSTSLKVEFTTNQNQIARAWATGEVTFAKADKKVSGDHADYDVAADRIRVGVLQPDRRTRWAMGDRSGVSEAIELRPSSEEFTATGHVAIELALNQAMLPALLATNQAARTGTGEKEKLQIVAGSFAHNDTNSIFRDRVVATMSQGRVDAELVTITTGATNQVTRLVAEQNVSIYQKDRVASGQKAIYEAATGLIELTGEPRIIDSQATIEAVGFIIDLGAGTFRTRGKYRINIHREPAQANNQPGAAQ